MTTSAFGLLSAWHGTLQTCSSARKLPDAQSEPSLDPLLTYQQHLGFEKALTQANLLGAQDPTVEFETPNAAAQDCVVDRSPSVSMTKRSVLSQICDLRSLLYSSPPLQKPTLSLMLGC